MVFKWREGQTPLFLEHYRKYTCLWDNKSKDYKNRDVRANAIKSLIEDLNIDGVTEEDVKLKIKSIRTKYTCELSKINRSTNSGCSTDDVYVPKLYWFKQADQFLNAVCNPRESSNFSYVDTDQITNTKVEQHWQVTDYEQDEEVQEGEGGQEAFEENSGLSQATNDHRSDDDGRSRALKFLKRRQFMPIKKALRHLKVISDSNREPPTENEYDLFCKSLAVQLKNMPTHRALICQQKLQSVMVEERLQIIFESKSESSYQSD